MFEILLSFLSWWVLLEIIGLAALPLCYRLFSRLPDGGYGLSKALGLLWAGYIFWLGAHFLGNSPRLAALAIGLVGLASALAYRRGQAPEEGLLGFLRRHRKVILAEEVIFGVAFMAWTFVRAYNPEISGTEKPMEITFLNATLRSAYFPPHDPWLSGFAISYYYFGYVLMAMLAQLSGLPSAVAFNLGIALLFALTASGAFSLAYNLAVVGGGEWGAGLSYGLLGSAGVVLIGNLEAVFEVLHNLPGALPDSFWAWLDIKNLATAPVSGTGIPTDHWWWWRASRVIHDVVGGQSLEVIDEFPFFSFLLGDMHPHVLALPFVLLALGFAFKILLARREKLDRVELVSLALVMGGLGFLNSWELPTYGLIAVLAYALGRWISGDRSAPSWIFEVLRFTVLLFVLSLALYLPFWISFRTQASGLLPVLFVKTRLHQYLIMFGLFIYVGVGFLIARGAELRVALGDAWARRTLGQAARVSLGLLIVPPVVALVLIGLVALDAGRRAMILEQLDRVASLVPPEIAVAARQTDLLAIAQKGWLEPLLEHPWLGLLLAALLGLAFFSVRGSLQHMRMATGSPPTRNQEASSVNRESSALFATLLLAVGLGLSLLSELFYIQDVFGTRMNTVFKLYYQAWVLLALATSYGFYYMRRQIPLGGGFTRRLVTVWSGGFALLLAASLLYPALSIPAKTASFSGASGLDGTRFLAAARPEDYEAIQWLRANIDGAPVILEATGGEYSEYGRVSAYTGLPTLLGWYGHELQWGRNADQLAGREPAIDRIYTSTDVAEVVDLLERYQIEYIYVGSLEIDQYGPQARDRFRGLLDVIYENRGVIIYATGHA